MLAETQCSQYGFLVPRKIRQLVTELEGAGFTLVHGGKGSHRKFRHPKMPGALILSGQS